MVGGKGLNVDCREGIVGQEVMLMVGQGLNVDGRAGVKC